MARSSTAGLTASGSQMVSGTLYSGESRSSWCRNHIRSCANDSGMSFSAPLRAPGSSARCSPCPFSSISSTTRARPRRVGASKHRASGTSIPNFSRRRETSCVARSECPPDSKKFSSPRGLPVPSKLAQIPASNCSVVVCKDVPSAPGAGNRPPDRTTGISRSGIPRLRRPTVHPGSLTTASSTIRKCSMTRAT